MRKRRRLADKLTIMVCAVLVAVSAFFYVPMEVEAEELYSFTLSSTNQSNGLDYTYWGSTHDFLDMNLDNNSYYKVDFNYDYSISSDNIFNFRHTFVTYNYRLFLNIFNSDASTSNSYKILNGSGYIVAKGSELNNDCIFGFDSVFRTPPVGTYNVSFSVRVSGVTPLTGEESATYQQGYNAGYSAGKQAGETNGYSNGYSDGFEAGEQSGYDSGYDAGVQDGFQSGQGSVDTQSYYDAGYNAGYDTGYLEGYDEGYNLGYDEGFFAGEAVGYEKGYESGWQAFKDKISGWGADTTEYPLLISSSSEPFDLDFHFLEATTDNFVYSDYEEFEVFLNDVNFDPNHTYKLVFTYHDFRWRTTLFFTSSFSCWLYWGSSSFPLVLDSVGNDITSSFYITGDRIGNNLRFLFDLGQIESSGTTESLDYFLDGCTFELYDMGPSGDTQNHIANQTDQLTGGYNDSQGNSVNNDFSSGLNEFETAEDSLFATATFGLKDFTFFDIQSVPAMVTGMSFVGSIMSGWFTQAGGASGVGIVLSILFSIMLVAMVLGLYRWYQSKGGKD